MISVNDAIELYSKDLDERTLCFLVDETNVLLGHKKTGFGNGYIVGIGGGVEKGETQIQAAVREVEEEVFVQPKKLTLSGVLDFYFPYVDKPRAWNQRVYVYLSKDWDGNPSESEEIKPEWFPLGSLPFEKMWDDASYWLNDILSGNEIWAQFTFDKDLKVDDNQKLHLSRFHELTSKGRGREKCTPML